MPTIARHQPLIYIGSSCESIERNQSMTIDKSLKIRAGGAKQRSVLTRAERIAKLKENDRWSDGDKVLGLPKVRVPKLAMKKKKKAKGPEGEAGAAEAGTAATPAAAKAPAAKAPAAKAPAKK
jgi:small basic protein (TIGR04137 family)